MSTQLSLGLKVVIALIISLLLINGGFGVYHYQSMQTDLQSKLQQKTNNVVDRLKVNLKESLWNMDADAIKASLQAELKDIEVAGILVKTGGKVIVGFTRTKDASAIVETAQLEKETQSFSITRESSGKTQELGTVSFAMNTQIIEDALTQLLIESIFSTLFLIAFLAIVLSLVIRSLVINPLKETMSEISNVRKTGDFSLRIRVRNQDELGELSMAFNELLTEQDRALEEIESVMQSLSRGQFNHQIKAVLTGDLGSIADKINTTVSQLDDVFNDVLKVMQEVSEGNFHPQQSNKRYEGVFAEVHTSINASTNALDTAITAINSVLNSMSKGDFSHRISAKLSGELDALKTNVNASIHQTELALTELNSALAELKAGNLNARMQGNLSGSFADMAMAYNDALTITSQSLSVVYESANSGIDRSHTVASNTNQLTARTQEQAASIEEVAATMEQMTSSINESVESAKSVDELATHASKEVTDSMTIMSKTIESMNLIEASSTKIAAITSLIDSIAFQTNLLALNAAVEAARAGEHGRGFAVVASEVRTLAQKSANAAKDINTLITDSVNKIQEGTRQAALAGHTLKQATGSVTQVSAIIKEIVSSSFEQSNGISQVKSAMSLIDSAVQESVQMSCSNSEAASDMQHEMNRLIQSINQFQFNRSLSAPQSRRLLK